MHRAPGGSRARSLVACALLAAFVAGPADGDTRVSRVGEDLFRLRHGSTFSAAGGGRKGAWRGMEKAASLCSALGFTHFRIKDSSQYQYPSSGGVGTRSGSTVLLVRCETVAQAQEQPALTKEDRTREDHLRIVVDYLPVDPAEELKVQRAIYEMLELESKEREKAEKLASRTPEQVEADEAKEEARRRKELEKMRRQEEKDFEKAKKKLGKPPTR